MDKKQQRIPYIIYYHSFDESDEGWTWLKWPAIPSEEIREKLKERFQARFSRKRLAWYIQFRAEVDRLVDAIGYEPEPGGVVEGSRPIKAWPKGFRACKITAW